MWLNILIAAVAALLIGIVATFFLAKPEPEVVVEYEEAYVPTSEEVYQSALPLINSDNPDSLRAGLEILETLLGSNYVPAIYELANTYGWTSDSASVSRKQLLGIDIYESGLRHYLPKSDLWTTKAMAYYGKVIEIADSSCAAINADAAYRMAIYYFNPNSMMQRNEDKARYFLNNAKEWATLIGDEALLERVNNGLEVLSVEQ